MISAATHPMGVFLHNPAPLELALKKVNLNKPAHYREVAFTDKTGGCNNEASVWGRTLAYWPVRGTRVDEK